MEFYVDEKQKRKNRRILKIKIYCWIVAFLILLAGIFYSVVYSSLFRVTQINTDLNTDLNGLDLINNLKIYFANQSKISGFLGAENILIWNNKIGDFLKQNPQIIGLSVKRNFFKREVKINFQKRERFGVWCQQAQINADKTQINTDNTQVNTDNLRKSASNSYISEFECWWFDKNGIAFEQAPRIEGEMIFKVEDFSEKQLAIGGKIMEESLFANLLKIFSILEQSNLGVRTLAIKNLSLQEAAVEAENMPIPKIYFSLRFDPAFTISAINALGEYGLNKIEYVDFRVENRAYYKTK